MTRLKDIVLISRHRRDRRSGGSLAAIGFEQILSNCFGDRLVVVAPEGRDEMCCNNELDFLGVPDRSSVEKVFYGLTRFQVDRFSPWVERFLRETRRLTWVFIDGGQLGRFAKIAEKLGAHAVVLHHNEETKYITDTDLNPIKKAVLKHVSDRNQRIAWKSASANWFLTEKDLDDFINLYGPSYGCSRVLGYHETTLFCPLEPSSSKAMRLIITGNLSVYKGYEGICWFLDEVWSLVDPASFSLTIAGRNPSASLAEIISRFSNVTLLANPDDMVSVVCEHDIYLNPNRVGSGMKIRNLDGLRAGLPVICHEANSYGFESLFEQSFYRFSDARSFSVALEQARSECASRSRVDRFKLYSLNFGISSGVRKLRACLDEVGMRSIR